MSAPFDADWPRSERDAATAVLERLRAHGHDVVVHPEAAAPGHRLDRWTADCPACGLRHGLDVHEAVLCGPVTVRCVAGCSPDAVRLALRQPIAHPLALLIADLAEGLVAA